MAAKNCKFRPHYEMCTILKSREFERNGALRETSEEEQKKINSLHNFFVQRRR